MQVFIMRHGEAATAAASDSLRPLTDRGITDSRAMARWLAAQHPAIDYILVSPYLRAEQTLDAVRLDLPLPDEAEVTPMLTPSGDAAMVASYLQVLREQGVQRVLVVSHLPLVGYLVSALCPQEAPPMFATSSVACTEVTAEGGTLVWHHSPCQL